MWRVVYQIFIPAQIHIALAPGPLEVQSFELIDLVFDLVDLSPQFILFPKELLNVLFVLLTPLPHYIIQIRYAKQRILLRLPDCQPYDIRSRYRSILVRQPFNDLFFFLHPQHQCLDYSYQFNKHMGQQEIKGRRCQGELQKFGRVEYIIRSDNGQSNLMQIRLQYHKDQQDFKRWVNEVKSFKIANEISRYLILPVRIERDNCQLCTVAEKRFTLKICYDKMNYSLLQIIKNRRVVKTFFTEAEVWHLLYVLIKYAAFCQQKSEFVGNIHPINIMIDQNSAIRIFTLLSSPSEMPNLARVKQSRHFDVYIAPEQIKFIDQDSMINLNDCNPNKVDLFNIGLVLLSTVMLKDCYYIYSRISFDLNHDKLAKLVEQMKKIHVNRYSSMLIAFIQEFLIVSPERRKTPQFFFNQLKHYERQIEQFNPFEFSEFSKIQEEGKANDWCISIGKSNVNQHLNMESPQRRIQRTSTESNPKFLSLAKHLKKSPEFSTIQKSKIEMSTVEKPPISTKLFQQ